MSRGKNLGYSKEIRIEQDVHTSGISYRYVNNVDPNKDLIIDSTKYVSTVNINKAGNVPPNFKEKNYNIEHKV